MDLSFLLKINSVLNFNIGWSSLEEIEVPCALLGVYSVWVTIPNGQHAASCFLQLKKFEIALSNKHTRA